MLGNSNMGFYRNLNKYVNVLLSLAIHAARNTNIFGGGVNCSHTRLVCCCSCSCYLHIGTYEKYKRNHIQHGFTKRLLSKIDGPKLIT